MRKARVEKSNPQLSVRRLSELLAVNRKRLKSERVIEPPELSGEDVQITRRRDEFYVRFREFGAGVQFSTRGGICGCLKRSMSSSSYWRGGLGTTINLNHTKPWVASPLGNVIGLRRTSRGTPRHEERNLEASPPGLRSSSRW